MYLFMFKHRSDLPAFLSQSLVTSCHCCVIGHKGVDESLRKICKYQQNVPQHYYLFDTLVINYTYSDHLKAQFLVLWHFLSNEFHLHSYKKMIPSLGPAGTDHLHQNEMYAHRCLKR